MNRPRTTARGIAFAITLLAAGTAPVMAAAKKPAPAASKPAKAEDAPMFMTYVSILVIAAAVVGANLIPSKRGHQD